MTIPLPNIGKTAARALEQVKLTSLNDISKLDEKTLLKIHGVGPKAIRILKERLREEDMKFSKPINLPINASFAVIGDLKCDNAPKRRIVRDFIIARSSKNKNLLRDILIDDIEWEIINKSVLSGFQPFYDEVLKSEDKISSVEISSNITHGSEGASETIIILNHGLKIRIADFFKFESHKKDAKIKLIKTYLIDEHT